MILNILRILASYLLGSISFSYIAGVLCKGIDIRILAAYAGTTNVLSIRTCTGCGCSYVMYLKEWLPYIWEGVWQEIIMLLCGIAVVVGHNYPVF